MAWAWRFWATSARRRTSRVGHSCACSRIGARRSPASSSITQVNGSYRRHSRRSSRICASDRKKTRPLDCPFRGSRVVSFVVILLQFPVDLRDPSHNTDAQNIASLLLCVVTPPRNRGHGVQGGRGFKSRRPDFALGPQRAVAATSYRRTGLCTRGPFSSSVCRIVCLSLLVTVR